MYLNGLVRKYIIALITGFVLEGGWRPVLIEELHAATTYPLMRSNTCPRIETHRQGPTTKGRT